MYEVLDVTTIGCTGLYPSLDRTDPIRNAVVIIRGVYINLFEYCYLDH